MSFEWQFASRICAWIEVVNLIIVAAITVVHLVSRLEDYLCFGFGFIGTFSRRVISTYWGFKIEVLPHSSWTSKPSNDLEAQPLGTLTISSWRSFFKVLAIYFLWTLQLGGNFLLHGYLTMYLFLATDKNVKPESALSHSHLWRIWTLVLLLLEIMPVVFGTYWNWNFKAKWPPIYRYVSLYIVSRYIVELEAV